LQEQTQAQAEDGAATPSMGCHIFSTSHFVRAGQNLEIEPIRHRETGRPSAMQWANDCET